ncbi:MAG: heparan-alpha-glucosaminide N-acetyltransferase domain-containing protein [Maribacter sp.]
MEKKTARLYFIDAMRAWAILMMLQGHFIDGLLDNAFRDNTDLTFNIWKYFRGITAPVFFTVSGFIFTYLLIKVPQKGMENPRIKKGLKRGLQLIFIGYLLRTNLLGILGGEIYDSFYLVDVLHCIGLSLLGIIGIYLLSQNGKKSLLPSLLIGVTGVLFLFEPIYSEWSFGFLPQAMGNYLTKANGSVFTIIPWFGYTTFGAFMSVLFTRYKNHRYLYQYAITLCLLTGLSLIFLSSDVLIGLSELTGISLFNVIAMNNYLFIRLGDVFLVFAGFMLLRGLMTNATVLKIGQSTLSIYVIHFIILYGSFTGLGLYRFFHHELSPTMAILGALVFMLVSSFTALQYEKHKAAIKMNVLSGLRYAVLKFEPWYALTQKLVKVSISKLLRSFGLLKN